MPFISVLVIGKMSLDGLHLAIAIVELMLDCFAPIPNAYFIFLLVSRHDLHKLVFLNVFEVIFVNFIAICEFCLVRFVPC